MQSESCWLLVRALTRAWTGNVADRDPEIVGRGNYPAYEADYAAWLDAQVELLGAGRFAELDLSNLIDEVASLGRSDFNGFVSLIKVVLLHLLKWDIQTDHRTRSWAESINGHRDQVNWELKDSPSYRARAEEAVERAYSRARRKAHKETKLPLRSFPESCPYSWDDIMTRPVVWGDDEQMKSRL